MIKFKPARKGENVYGPHKFYTKYQEMLKNHQLDLVCVATRAPNRTNIITACVDSVKALHVEKSICNSLVELNVIEKKLKKVTPLSLMVH